LPSLAVVALFATTECLSNSSVLNILPKWREITDLEAEDFNESWDDSFGEFVMGDYSYPASEILFNVDKQAYVNEYKSFTEGDV
jgi:hypothetical protein